MSQNLSNQPSGSPEQSGRAFEENGDRKKYEGFEGMNYEQRRQPYQQRNASGGGDGNQGAQNGQRRDEH